MQIKKNELTTGLLVILTFGFFIIMLVIIGMPGVITKLNTYRIYFDNAEGIHTGAPVLLAGREIGKVVALNSPIAFDKRPQNHPDYEVSIDVQVNKNAKVYYNEQVRLVEQGLLGQEVIDFVHGDAASGLASNNTEFVGERIPNMSEAITTNMEKLFEPDSDLSVSIKNARTFMETLNNSHISELINNTEAFTGILKREPWRLVWPGSMNNSSPNNGNSDQRKSKHHKSE